MVVEMVVGVVLVVMVVGVVYSPTFSEEAISLRSSPNQVLRRLSSNDACPDRLGTS